MNDIEKAIKYYKGMVFQSDMSERTLEAIRFNKLAIQALEKQIAKPPEHKVHPKYKVLGKNYYCSCGVMFVDFERNGTNYCGNCGQKLREVEE